MENVMEQPNAFRTDHLMAFSDSSNYARDGEGIPEMLQRKAKEQKQKELAKYNAKAIADRLLKGDIVL